MDALYINGNRNGYAPEQCGQTLTVGELIRILTDYMEYGWEDVPVYLMNDNGYTYGSITALDIIPDNEICLE